MRSKDELRAQCDAHGLYYTPETASRQLMDMLRDKLGVADPDQNIDPMKAKDLKNSIDWSSPTPFLDIENAHAGKNFIIEPKLDGARVRIIFGTTGNSVLTGRRSDVTYGYIDRADRFPHIQKLRIPELAGTVLDAEVLMPPNTSIDLGPKKGFTKGPLNTVMAVLGSAPDKAIERQNIYGNAVFHAFDILNVSGEPLSQFPLQTRRSHLKRVIGMVEKEVQHIKNEMRTFDEPAGFEYPIQLIPAYSVAPGIVQSFLDQGYEGAMLKDLNAPYFPGKRHAAWQKIKTMSTGDFFIIGAKPGTGKNEGKVGSLRLGYYDPELAARGLGDTVPGAVYVADARGFDDATCAELSGTQTGTGSKQHGGLDPAHIGKVVEIMGQGRTKNDRIRHPHFIRFRPDKTEQDCTRTQLELFPEV